MEESFSSIDFLKDLAEELIDGFRKAGKATTPGMVGSAREKEIRSKLELIFPQSIGDKLHNIGYTFIAGHR